ncbi:hypothetical protein CSB20_04025 [bacterium DOLZORAL124_64_63]|nr:MAG: hypothetical protein CSB20_04025 [bacterium DOLZORAL124_64_63]
MLVAIVLLVGGIGLLKWTDSDKGQATLLALGAERAFGEVQQAVEAVLVQALPGFVPGPAGEGGADPDWPLPALGAEAAVRCRTVEVRGDAPYERIQLDLDRRLRESGARVLWAQRLYPRNPKRTQRRPNNQLDALRLDVGVPGRPTHTLVLHREGRRPDFVWGDQVGSPLWQRLVQRAAGQPVLAVVIDDWGHARTGATAALLDLPAPLTMAVLPRLPNSRHFALMGTDLVLPDPTPASSPEPSVAAQAVGRDTGRQRRLAAGCFVELRMGKGERPMPARRRETILHLPMQPQGYPDTNPGADPLLVGMDAEAIGRILARDLKNVPGVRGLNNHMGSAATSDKATMQALMGLLREKGLFFLDSLTSSRSVAYATAREMGVPALRNRIFLDYDSENEETIAANLAVAVRTARARGFAVIIGHPHPATARVLTRRVPQLLEEGVVFVTASEMLALMDEADRRKE